MTTFARRTARLSLVAKGLLYALVAVLALQIAFGSGGSEADSAGALHTVARQPLGRALVLALAAGFAVYAGWQLFAAVRGDGWYARLAAALRGAVWAFVSVTAVRIVLHDGVSADQEETLTSRILAVPFGPALVVGAGIAAIVIGLMFLRRLRDHAYLDDLRPLRSRTRTVVKVVAITGHVAKTGVFALTGAFLIRAALAHRPKQGIGLDGALSQVAQEPYGTYALLGVAVGLVAYAAWCGVRARYENLERSDGAAPPR